MIAVATRKRRRLISLRLMCLNDDVPRAYVEYRLDKAGRAIVISGSDTVAAEMYGRGACTPAKGYEARIATGLADYLGIPFEAGRFHRPDEGDAFLVCVYADNRPRTYTWAEAIVSEGGVERVFGARVITRSHRVLVALEDPRLRDSITRALQRAGAFVEQAANGRHVGEVLGWPWLDVAVVHLDLPALDAAGLLAQAFARAKPVPLILLAEFVTAEDRARAIALGAASVHEATALDMARLVADVENAAAAGAPR